MKKQLLFLIVLFVIPSSVLIYGQSDNYFKLTFVKTFSNGQSNQVSYINFPNVSLWGWVEVTITGGYNHQLNKGKLTKRYALMYNAGGYFNQSTEVPTAFGELANQWNIGDYDKDNHRIPIYHLVSTGNDITIEIEGVLQHTSSVNSIQASLSISNPVIVSNSETRQYMSIMQPRVGIGTTSPDNSLTVNGNFKVVNSNNFFSYNGAADIRLKYAGRGEGGRAIVHDNGNVLTFNYDGDFSGGTKIGNTAIFKESSDEYQLEICGKIRAREIKIDLEGCDFVFDENFHLKPLSEVENFIKQNKRLPEIKSAAEMERDGTNLGELNSQLLQKIEELTLYVIDLQKQVDDLKSQLNK